MSSFFVIITSVFYNNNIPVLVAELERQWLTPQDVVRRWFEARRGRFSSLGTVVPKGLLA